MSAIGYLRTNQSVGDFRIRPTNERTYKEKKHKTKKFGCVVNTWADTSRSLSLIHAAYTMGWLHCLPAHVGIQLPVMTREPSGVEVYRERMGAQQTSQEGQDE